MGAPTEYYVDPSIAADSGAGTVGDPWGDLEYALLQITRDATNGDKINIKSSGQEEMAAAFDIVTDYGSPTLTAPLIFRGYTTAADDGGIGVIDMNGPTGAQNVNNCHWIDLEFKGSSNGGAIGLQTGQNSIVYNCYVHGWETTGIKLSNNSICAHNRVRNTSGDSYGIDLTTGLCAFNYIDMTPGTNAGNTAIRVNTSTAPTIYRNIIKVDGGCDGIECRSKATIMHNNVWSNGGTGSGIATVSTNLHFLAVIGNVVEGFSGTGGIGLDLDSTGWTGYLYGANAVRNCATAYTAPGNKTLVDLGDNETLTASPFTDASNDDFNPVDTGNVKEGALPDDFLDS